MTVRCRKRGEGGCYCFPVWKLLWLMVAAVSSHPFSVAQLPVRIDSLQQVLYRSLDYNLTAGQKKAICDTLATYYSRNKQFDRTVEFSVRSLNLVRETGDDSSRIFPLEMLADAYFRQDKYGEADTLFRELIHLVSIYSDDERLTRALFHTGLNYFQWSRYDSAKAYYEKALFLARRMRNEVMETEAMHLLSGVLIAWGDYEEALTILQRNLEYRERTGDIDGLARTCNSLGILYQELGDLPKAREYYSRSLEYINPSSTGDVMNVILHIGDIYLMEKNYDEALVHYFRALDMGGRVQSRKLSSIALSNIGEAYLQMGEYREALKYQEQALALKLEIGDNKRLAITYNELGLIYFRLGMYGKAREFLELGLKAGLQSNLKKHIIDSYERMSDVHEALGNYREALEYHRSFVTIRDSLYSDESKRILAEMQTRYETAKKEKENERLRSAEQLQKVKLKNRTLFSIFIIVVFLFALSFAVMYYRRHRVSQRINEQLSRQNLLIGSQKRDMQHLNRELNEANDAKDKFLSILAHDLRNPFTSLIGCSQILDEDWGRLTEEEARGYVLQLRDTSRKAFSLLESLLEWARAKAGKAIPHPVDFPLQSLADEAVNLALPNAQCKEIDIRMEINKPFTVHADRNMMLTVLFNLLSNAVKFTGMGGRIELSANARSGMCEVCVADNGIGIAPDDLSRLFRVDEKVQTRGTSNETGTGLGLILCRELVEMQGGRIWAESTPGHGSRFCFTIPLKGGKTGDEGTVKIV
ncbi:MAG: tetratricopeptide repeat protein [Bacteroidales bacterium]|nr:tetratricopeptide repeat protein [Bacteroidales bacterium]